MKNKCFFILLFCCVVVSFVVAQQNAPTSVANDDSEGQFVVDWKELDKRPLPDWFNKAKFGIFVVWGPYSVPSWMPVRKDGYAEWYWNRLNDPSPKNDELRAFHKRVYGDKIYEQLANNLTAELFNADDWCKLFARSGAKYVVTTASYHDGFAMYPTQYSETASTKEWNSMLVGPKRDIIGELNEAGNKLGLKMGIYFSLYEWYNPLWLSDKDKFVSDFLHPKFKEAVTRYKPWSIFFDGDWTMPGEKWRSNELARWLYEESPVKDDVVVNDRWGSSRGKNGDVFESEYGFGKWNTPHHPWQEDRGIGESYGYNRNENIAAYASSEELIRLLCNIAGNGGNLLLCVGPTADGRIPVIMQERLAEIGDWLKYNGKAIYDTKPNPFWPRTFEWGTITAKTDTLFLHILDSQTSSLALEGISGKIRKMYLQDGADELELPFKFKKNRLNISWAQQKNNKAATVIGVVTSGTCEFDKAQRQFSDHSLILTANAFAFQNTSAQPRYGGFRNRFKVIGWDRAEGTATSDIEIDEPGRYQVLLSYWTDKQDEPGSEVAVEIAGQRLAHTTENSVETENFEFPDHVIGEVIIGKPGRYSIRISPKTGGIWNGFGFRSFGLKPVLVQEKDGFSE